MIQKEWKHDLTAGNGVGKAQRMGDLMDLKALAKELVESGKLTEFLSLAVSQAVPASCYVEGPNGNVYFRPMLFEKAGDVMNGHTHNFDHVTHLYRGSFVVKFSKDGKKFDERIYRAPARILIKRDVYHEFTALEDDTASDCIFALRDFDGNVTDAWNGSKKPYV